MEQVKTQASACLATNDYMGTITPLHLVPSSKEQNRRAYLIKEVIERYFANNSDFLRRYFAAATDPRRADRSQ